MKLSKDSMSDGLLDSIVSSLRDHQLQSESSRVLRAHEAAEQAISASRVSSASRQRGEITPVPDDILRTSQTLPKAAVERRSSKRIDLYRTRHATLNSALSVPLEEVSRCRASAPLCHFDEATNLFNNLGYAGLVKLATARIMTDKGK